MKLNRWQLTLFSISITLVLGCRIFTNLFQTPDLADLQVPEIPEPPKLAVVIGGTPEEQAVYVADLLSKDETRLAGWLGLYDVFGIPVIGRDGVTLGTTRDDPIGPDYWEIWASSGMDRTGRGIPLSGVGPIIAVGVDGVDGALLGQQLLEDLRKAVKSDEPQARLLAHFLRQRVLRASHADLLDPNVPAEDLIIDLPTVQLLTWILHRGILMSSGRIDRSALGRESGSSSLLALAIFQQQSAKPSPDTPCTNKFGGDDLDRRIEALLNKNKDELKPPAAVRAFPSVLATLQRALGMDTKKADEAGELMKRQNMITMLINLATVLTGLDIDAVQEADPLERTKTTTDGQPGKITWAVTSDASRLPDPDKARMACLILHGISAGLTFSFPTDGRVNDVRLLFKGRTGFTNLVRFNQPKEPHPKLLSYQFTDSNGEVTTPVIGKGQKRTIPESAKPEDKEFSIHVSAKPQLVREPGSISITIGGFVITDKVGDQLGRHDIELLTNIHFELGEYVFRLKDWKPQGYRASGSDGPTTYSGVICSLEEPFSLTVTHPMYSVPISFTPTSSTAGTASYSGGSGPMTMSGNGSYKVTGAETERPELVVNLASTAQIPVAKTSGSGIAHIQLTELETGECAGKTK